MGKAVPSYTFTNHTITSFVDFVCANKWPHPAKGWNNKLYKKKFNYIESLDDPIYFLSDNAHLHPTNLQIKALLKCKKDNGRKLFEKYIVYEPFFKSCKKILDGVNSLDLGDNYLVFLWFGNTHQPYELDGDINERWDSSGKKYIHYNDGMNSISPKEMEDMHDLQVKACSYVVDQLWRKFLHNHRNADIIITSDHGESFGEDHIYGHGSSVNRAQFSVPFLTNRRKPQ